MKPAEGFHYPCGDDDSVPGIQPGSELGMIDLREESAFPFFLSRGDTRQLGNGFEQQDTGITGLVVGNYFQTRGTNTLFQRKNLIYIKKRISMGKICCWITVKQMSLR